VHGVLPAVEDDGGTDGEETARFDCRLALGLEVLVKGLILGFGLGVGELDVGHLVRLLDGADHGGAGLAVDLSDFGLKEDDKGDAPGHPGRVGRGEFLLFLEIEIETGCRIVPRTKDGGGGGVEVAGHFFEELYDSGELVAGLLADSLGVADVIDVLGADFVCVDVLEEVEDNGDAVQVLVDAASGELNEVFGSISVRVSRG